MQVRFPVVALLAGLSLSVSAIADVNTDQAATPAAVSSVNGELSLDWGKTKYEDDGEESWRAIGGQGNIPLAQAFGLNLSAKQVYFADDFDTENTVYSVAAFWRDPRGGLLGYGRGRTKIKSSISDAKADTSLIVAAAYSEVATLSVASEKIDLVDGADGEFKFFSYNIVAYPSPNFLLHLAIGAKDIKDNYSLAFEHQLASVPSLSYGLTYGMDRNDPESTSWLLTVSFRAGAQKTLVGRYHGDLFGVR